MSVSGGEGVMAAVGAAFSARIQMQALEQSGTAQPIETNGEEVSLFKIETHYDVYCAGIVVGPISFIGSGALNEKGAN